MRAAFCLSCRRATGIGCAIVLVLWAWVGLHSSFAATGPFADFPGNWSGTGTLRGPEKTERIRCSAGYRPLGGTSHEINLQLRCDSDSYKFDLAGQFQADGNNIPATGPSAPAMWAGPSLAMRVATVLNFRSRVRLSVRRCT